MEKNKSLKLMWIMILVLVGFNFLDVSITILGVMNLGLCSEGNYVVKKYLSSSPELWLNLKLFSSLFVLGSGFVFEKVDDKQVYSFVSIIYGIAIGLFSLSTMNWIFGILGKIQIV